MVVICPTSLWEELRINNLECFLIHQAAGTFLFKVNKEQRKGQRRQPVVTRLEIKKTCQTLSTERNSYNCSKYLINTCLIFIKKNDFFFLFPSVHDCSAELYHKRAQKGLCT